ncbi:phosphorylase family protein [Vibrio metschnikovii]
MRLHINAQAGAFAETILMPGDPLRAKFIAETYLDDVTQVCDVRNMFGYTGFTRCQTVRHGSRHGIPSASIYVHELLAEYGVKNIIRIGSCGAVRDDVNLMDVVIAMGASTDSKVNRIRFGGHDFAAVADYDLLETAVNQARAHQIQLELVIFSLPTSSILRARNF